MPLRSFARLARRALITIFAGALLLPVAGRAAAPDLVRMGFLDGDANAEPYYAQEKKIFARYNLVVTTQGNLGGANVLRALKAGKIDLGFANVVSLAGEVQHGAPLVLLAPGEVYNAASPTSALVQAPSTNYTTGSDLNGKTIASPSGMGSLGALGPQLWIDKNGGDSTTVHMVTGYALADIPGALASGKLDAAELTEPDREIRQQRGEVKLLAPTFNAIAPHFLIGGWVARKGWVDAHPDAAHRFVAAMRETARWANAHHAQTAAIVARRLKLPLDLVRAMPRATYGEVLAAATIQPPLDVAARYNIIAPMRAAVLIGPPR